MERGGGGQVQTDAVPDCLDPPTYWPGPGRVRSDKVPIKTIRLTRAMQKFCIYWSGVKNYYRMDKSDMECANFEIMPGI